MSQTERLRVQGAGLGLLNGKADSFLRVFTGKLSGERGVVESSDVARFFFFASGSSNDVCHP